jgi:hypothetical protein
MPEIVFKIDEGGLGRMKRYTAGLVKGAGSLRRIHRHASWKFAKHVEQRVREKYQGYDGPGPGTLQSTIEAYRRPPLGSRGYRATATLRRSGLLSRSVVTRKDGQKGWRVQIDPNKRYPSGVLVSVVAHRQEVGYVQRMIMTRERLAYLHILQPGDQGVVKEGDNVPVAVAARPVWEPTFRKLRSWRRVYEDAVKAWLKQKGTRRVPGV